MLTPQELKNNIIAQEMEILLKTRNEANSLFNTLVASEDPIELHHWYGRYIRNCYSLWEIDWEPAIINGVDYSDSHPDQLSNDVIVELSKRCKAIHEINKST